MNTNLQMSYVVVALVKLLKSEHLLPIKLKTEWDMYLLKKKTHVYLSFDFYEYKICRSFGVISVST